MFLPSPGTRLLSLPPGPDPPGGASSITVENELAQFELRDESDMVCVLEYGENIGTLRNLFRDEEQAVVFAKHIIELSEEEYTCIATNKWYCSQKDEYVEVQEL